MSLAEFFTLLAFCTAMSFSPGPNTTLSTALAANHGLAHALRFCFGVPFGWTLLMLLTGLGLGALIVQLPALRWAIQALGLGYMLWLAWRLAGLNLSKHSKLDNTAEASGQTSSQNKNLTQIGFWHGVVLQFVNVKAWLLALAISAGWVLLPQITQPQSHTRLLIVCALMWVFAFTSNFCYALTGALLRNWLAHGQRLLWFNRVLALVLVATALWMVRL